METKGYVHVYTGNGKGKTTAAFGLALRALCAGKGVYVGQFVKSMKYNETKIERLFNGSDPAFGRIRIEQLGRGCFIGKDPELADAEAARKGWTRCADLLRSGEYDVVILNFANCDMVGHTGVFDAAVKAVEAVDDALSKVVPAILAKGGFALITADHGNADHMFDVASDGSKHPFTAHTTNRVPFIIVDEKAQLTGIEDGRLSDIAPTMLTMAGLEPSAEMTGRVLATEA